MVMAGAKKTKVRAKFFGENPGSSALGERKRASALLLCPLRTALSNPSFRVVGSRWRYARAAIAATFTAPDRARRSDGTTGSKWRHPAADGLDRLDGYILIILIILAIITIMENLRSMPATEVKTNFGDVLASISTHGPVVVTRNGKEVAVLTALAPKCPPELVASLTRKYASGQITWPDIRDRYDIAFGDLLAELARQNLRIPRERDLLAGSMATNTFVKLLRDCSRA